MRAPDRHHCQPIEPEHARVLGLLRAAGRTPLTLAALEHAGVRNSATIVYELELRGYLIDHVTGGVTSGFRLSGIAADAATLNAA